MRPRPFAAGVALLAALAGAAATTARAWDDARRPRGAIEVKTRAPADDPADALFAAAEAARAGGAFYETLFARGLRSDTAVRTIAAAADAGARAVLRRHIALGAAGLPLTASPFWRAEGDKREKAIAKAAGLASNPPKVDPSPEYIPATGAPGKYPVISTAALGHALLAQVRVGARLLAPGHSPANRHEGLVLLACASAAIDALPRHFAFDGRALQEASAFADYDPYGAPRYFPATLAVRDAERVVLEVQDGASRLEAAAAILLGAAEYARLADPIRSPETAAYFGPPKDTDPKNPDEIFPRALVNRAKDIVRLSFRNLAALHFDPDPKRLAFMAEARPGERRARVATAEAALALLALEAEAETFPEDAALRAEARKLAQSRGGFLADRIAASKDGALPAAFDLEKGATTPPDLGAEALAVRGLLAAARLTGDAKLAGAAARLARSIEERRLDPWAGLYLGEPGVKGPFAIGPRDGPAVLGMLRDLTLLAPEGDIGAGGAGAPLDRFADAGAALVAAGALPSPEDGSCAVVHVEAKRP